MIELLMDGQKVSGDKGATILAVARDAGFHIPTLCHHDALSPAGACRICIVEIGCQGAEPFLTTSCNFPIEGEMEVWTGSNRVLEARSSRVRFLMKKAPASRAVQEMAADLGIETTPSTETESNCILCSLCVRVCREAVGAKALQLATRKEGAEPHVEVSPKDCIGCGACSLVCPTGFIKMSESEGQRIIWERTFAMKRCSHCHSNMTTDIYWRQLEERAGTLKDYGDVVDLCPVCRRGALSAELLDIPQEFSSSLFTHASD